MQQLRLLLDEKSTYFAAPEVTLVFSMARCLSIKWLGRWGDHFLILGIVEGSSAVVVIMAASQIKAVELDV